MANVSLAMPAIHPTLDIGSLPAVESPSRVRAGSLRDGDWPTKPFSTGAAAMAQTVIDLASDRRHATPNALLNANELPHTPERPPNGRRP